MFSLDLTLKSCILWIFFLICRCSLHFHCEFIRVCCSPELLLLLMPSKTAHTQNNNKTLGKNHKSFQIHSFFCSWWYLCAFAPYFGTNMSHLRVEILLFSLFSIQMNNFKIFSLSPLQLHVDYAWNFLLLAETWENLMLGEKIPFCRYSSVL